MTEHYTVVADRDKGDDPQISDLLTYSTRKHGHDVSRAELVRIERPVPTTDKRWDKIDALTREWRQAIITDDEYSEAVHALLPPAPHPPTREQIAEALPSRIEIHRIICGQFGGPSTHDHHACENAANAVHAALIQNGADR